MDSKNVIAAISLSAAVIILYGLFFAPEPQQINQTQQEKNEIVESSDAPKLVDTQKIDLISRDEAINSSNKVAMSLSDLFCVERHKPNFLELVKSKLDITFSNEQEIMSLIDVKKFDDVISFAKEVDKLIVITRGEKGSIAISKNEIVECSAIKNLKIKDLTGAGDLFASGFLHGQINNKTLKESLEIGTSMSSKVIQIIGARLNG